RAYFTGEFLPYCFFESVYVVLVFLAADLQPESRHHSASVTSADPNLADATVWGDLFPSLPLVISSTLGVLVTKHLPRQGGHTVVDGLYTLGAACVDDAARPAVFVTSRRRDVAPFS